MQAAVTQSRQGEPAPERVGRPFTVAVIDDQYTGREIIGAIVSSADPSVRVEKFADPVAGLAWIAGHETDMVFTDFRMPKMTGSEVVRAVRALPHCADVPIVVVTALDGRTVCYEALEAGATEFLTKPIDRHECLMRFRNLMTLRRQQLALSDRASALASQVDRAISDVELRERETLLLLAKAGEFRDTETGRHVDRVARYSALVARGLRMSEEEVHQVELAAPLHDIGKIAIPDSILRKPEPLTRAEFGLVRTHAEIGYEMLKTSTSKYIMAGAMIALTHHEKFDGSGYPAGLRGDDIPLPGRIVAVADALDALTTARPYKPAWTFDRAVEAIRHDSGAHFDTRCVDALLARLDDARAVHTRLADPGSSARHGATP